MDSYSYMIYVGYVWLCINIYIYLYGFMMVTNF